MADPKNTPTNPRKQTTAGAEPTGLNGPTGDSRPAEAQRPTSGGTAESSADPDNTVGTRRRRYLCAVRTTSGLAPMAAEMYHNFLNERLTQAEGVEVVKRLKPSSFGALSAGIGGGTGMPEVIVAEMDVERGEALRAQAASNPNFVVEVDRLLKHHGEEAAHLSRTQIEATLLPQASASVDLKLRIVGAGDRPLSGATVFVYGMALPAQGTTDANGEVALTVFGGPIDTIRAIYVKPAADHWERFLMRPSLAVTGTNAIQLRPLTQTFPNFPNEGIVGWGQNAMRLDAAPAALTGRGVRIGIIDSGCDNAHPQLTHVRDGFDFTVEPGSPATWIKDELSHGTHCAGIITGARSTVQGIRGFAPEAEVHAFKVFPGGRFSNLIDALDQCIAREIDVVNMSLGSDQPSELVTRKIQEAVDHGIALIVAAGNSGGPVQFPGNVPGVCTVSAVGQLNQYPQDTNHAQNVLPGGIGDMFPAKFSCFGPQVRVCGPGVAIVSSVPGGGYAAWDGTSMATPHITGLAALILAHHPAFQGPKQRNGARVAQLFQVLQAACTPCVIDVQRGGAGLPSTVALFGAATQATGTGEQPSPTRPSAPGQPAPPINVPVAAAAPGSGIPPSGGEMGGVGGFYQSPYAQSPYAGYFGLQQQAGMLDPAVIQAIALLQLRAAGLI